MIEENENGQEPEKEPTLEGTIQVDFYQNGNVRVRNFPKDVHKALRVMSEAQMVLFGHLLGLAMSGRLQAAPKSNIIQPQLMVNQQLLKKIKGGRAD